MATQTGSYDFKTAKAAHDATEDRIDEVNEGINALSTETETSLLAINDALYGTATSDGLQTLIERAMNEINGLDLVLTQRWENIQSYMEFGEEGGQPVLVLGSSESPFKVLITNQEILFQDNGANIAYMNGAKLHVANSLSFGSYSFVERDNGHFTLKLAEV